MPDGAALKGSLVTLSLVPLVFSSWDVHAYIDAGTGSLVLQVLVAGIVGGLFLIKVYWNKLRALFRSLFLRAGKQNE